MTCAAHLGDLHVGRISQDGAVGLLVPGITDELLVPDAEVPPSCRSRGKDGDGRPGGKEVREKPQGLPEGPSAATISPCPQGSPEVPAVGGVVDVGAEEGVYLLGAGDVPGVKDLVGRRVKRGAGMPIFSPPVGTRWTKVPRRGGAAVGNPKRRIQTKKTRREGDPGRVAQEEGKDLQPSTPLPAGIGEPLSRTPVFPWVGGFCPWEPSKANDFDPATPDEPAACSTECGPGSVLRCARRAWHRRPVQPPAAGKCRWWRSVAPPPGDVGGGPGTRPWGEKRGPKGFPYNASLHPRLEATTVGGWERIRLAGSFPASELRMPIGRLLSSLPGGQGESKDTASMQVGKCPTGLGKQLKC